MAKVSFVDINGFEEYFVVKLSTVELCMKLLYEVAMTTKSMLYNMKSLLPMG